MKYPDDCIQSLIGADGWWEKNDTHQVVRGTLISCFVPHPDRVPYTFEVMGRTEPTEHARADVRVRPLHADHVARKAELPVAAMPLHQGEVWAAYRAKVRPCLVLSSDAGAGLGAKQQAVGSTMLVAPFYALNAKATSGASEFLERVRHCEYPGLMWDLLPTAAEQAILRLDLLQPMGCSPGVYTSSEYKLSPQALPIVDAFLDWHIRGQLPANHTLTLFRDLMRSEFGTE